MGQVELSDHILLIRMEDEDVESLISSILRAAKRDVHISEGKAFSQQEEAVLKALDIM